MASYQYNLTDFLNDIVDLQRLTQEIDNSVITDTLTGITSHSGIVIIEFLGTLDQDEQTVLNGIVAAHTGDPLPIPLNNFLDSNSIVSVSGYSGYVEGDFLTMQCLVNRREIFNDTDNPIWTPSVTPILGTSGYLQDHANRILNVETIHDKLHWHQQQVMKAEYRAPKSLLIYYGYPNSFNSGTNGWSNEKVALDMSKYDLIILGDTVQSPAHADYANTQIIIPRIKALNPTCRIFGYVNGALALATFQTNVDQWNTLQVHGIFVDQAGYDFGTTATNSRTAMNTKVDYIHSKTYSSRAFMNAWNTDHIIGTANDASYPNITWNSGLVASTLTSDDWLLLESFPVNTSAYVNDIETATEWLTRGNKALGHRSTYGINLAAIGIIENTLGNNASQNFSDFQFVSALMFSLDASGTSDVNYASSSVTVKHWPKPPTYGLEIYTFTPSIQQDLVLTDYYKRFLTNGMLSLNFNTSTQQGLVSAWFSVPNSASQALSSNFTTANVSGAPTNLSVPVGANEYWIFEYQLTTQAGGNAGMKYSIAAPTGSTIEGWIYSSLGAITTMSFQRLTAINTLNTTALHTVATTPGPDTIAFVLRTGATPGNVTLQAASGNSNQTLTIFANSYVNARKVVLV